MEPQSISHNQQPLKCSKNYFLHLLLLVLPEQLRSDVLPVIQQMSVLSLKSVRLNNTSRSLLLHVTALVACRVRGFIQTRKVTGRLIAGIFLAGCLAPLSDIFYAFDFFKQFPAWNHYTENPAWYYNNYADLFLCLGPYIAWILAALGLNFMFIPETSKKKCLISISIFYPVIKILWLLQVTSDPEFHSIPPFAFWLYGIGIAVCLWFAAEYLVYLFNHKILNAVSTLDNITNNRKNLPAEQVVEMYAATCNKMKANI